MDTKLPPPSLDQSPEPMVQPQLKKTSPIFLILAVGGIAVAIGLLIMAGVMYLRYSPSSVVPGEQVACTMDAQICPDGTAVGRTGPNCEFAPCPASDEISMRVCPKDLKICPDGSSVGRTGPKCEFVCGGEVQSVESSELKVASFVPKTDDKGNVISGEPQMDMILNLPAGTQVLSQTSEGMHRVQIEGNLYVVTSIEKTEGLCPFSANVAECSYTDESFPSWSLLRIWKDQRGVFALNPQAFNQNGYRLEQLILKKENGQGFDPAQVQLWEDILQTISLKPSSLALE